MKSNPESIRCGHAEDSFEALKKACEKEANNLCVTLNLAQGDVVEIPFWTSDFPDLICVGKFSKSDKGVTYELDFSESTL